MRARSSLSRGLLSGLIASLALTVAGCGSGTKSEDDVANVPQTGASAAGGRLSTPPQPLRLADLRREQQGSPQATIIRLVFFAQWGSSPNIANAYHPAVRQGAGISNIVGAFSQQRAVLATSRPRIIESTTTSAGTFVSIELLRADAPAAKHSFVLRRHNGQWRIVFDTLLEAALQSYVANLRSRNPASSTPDRLALRQGRLAARKYRDSSVLPLDR